MKTQARDKENGIWRTTPDLLFVLTQRAIAVEAKHPTRASGITSKKGIGEVLQRIGHAVELQQSRNLKENDCRIVLLTCEKLNCDYITEKVWAQLQYAKRITHWQRGFDLYTYNSMVVEALLAMGEQAFKSLFVMLTWGKACDAMAQAARRTTPDNEDDANFLSSLADRMTALRHELERDC